MQLAYYKMTGELAPAYEADAKNSRTEVIRSATAEASTVRAMESSRVR